MRILFGPPGTGKTQALLDLVRDELDDGVRPDRIAFLAFSRRAAGEARERAEAMGLGGDDLRWWGTLHSTAARRLGVGPNDLMGVDHLRELGGMLDMRLVEPDEEGRVFESPDRRGSAAQAVVSMARAQQSPLRDVWNPDMCRWEEASSLYHSLASYKRERGLRDYADLLDDAPSGLPVDVVFLDEAQDLTPAQWSYFHRAVAGASRVYVAGDDDQAIYEWAGADVPSFLSLEGERRVLRQSHRLPRRVFDLADRIVRRIRVRQPKDWGPADREGAVHDAPDPTRVPIEWGEWLLLARTRFLVTRWESECRDRGVPYLIDGSSSIRPDEARAVRAWETARRGRPVMGSDLSTALELARRPMDLESEREYTLADLGIEDPPIWREALTKIPAGRRHYYESCLRRNPRALTDPPRVVVSTIHGAKGAQADRVALMIDIPPRAELAAVKDPDPEHRVWYVATTRARHDLHLVRPLGDRAYRV